MRFIVSPAKKMNVANDTFAWRHLPRFVNRAALLAEEMRALSYGDVKDLWRCSDALADLNFNRFRSMDVHGGPLSPAVFAYEGIQYQHLAPQIMTSDQLEYVQEHLRILSGFYGVLRPFDGVVPYRLEMQAKLTVRDAKNLYEFWSDRLYRTLAEETDLIVNLASVEYSKAVMPHAVAKTPRMVTCLFGMLDGSGRLVQRSTAAKAARGSMVRWCAERGARTAEDLRAFDGSGYKFDQHRSDEDCFVFVRES